MWIGEYGQFRLMEARVPGKVGNYGVVGLAEGQRARRDRREIGLKSIAG